MLFAIYARLPRCLRLLAEMAPVFAVKVLFTVQGPRFRSVTCLAALLPPANNRAVHHRATTTIAIAPSAQLLITSPSKSLRSM